jgi:peptide deformylase
MAVRDTLQIGDQRLKDKNQKILKVDDKIQQVIRDLIDTMHENQLIGMAAPQIGENYCLFVTEPRETKTRPPDQSDKLRVYINPQITQFSSKKNIIFEGCGSVLHGQLFGPVERSQKIKIDYYDEQMKKHWLQCDGILARVIQHEYDHLSGIEFTEKISDYRQLCNLEHYKARMLANPKYLLATQITLKNEG